MSRVKAATDGTAEEMQALTKAAQSAGSSTKYTSVEAAGALENLAKAGLSAEMPSRLCLLCWPWHRLVM